jgi:hypothetical protein
VKWNALFYLTPETNATIEDMPLKMLGLIDQLIGEKVDGFLVT